MAAQTIRAFPAEERLLTGVDAVGGNFYLGDSPEREYELYQIFRRLLRGLPEDVGDSVSNGGLKGHAARV